MNYDESAQVLTKILVGFPHTKWPEATEHEWLHELVINDIDYPHALTAAKQLRDTLDFAPTWHQFLVAYREAWAETHRQQQAAKALQEAAKPKDKKQAENLAGFQAFRSRLKNEWPDLPVNRSGSGIAIDYSDNRSARGHANHKPGDATHCPKCKKHDHTDKTVIGYSVTHTTYTPPTGAARTVTHREPIPAWHLTCRRCGSIYTNLMDNTCDEWTSRGIALVKQARQAAAGQ